MLLVPEKEFPKIRLKNEIVNFDFIKPEKIVEIFGEMKPKITPKTRNLQEIIFPQFSKDARKTVKNFEKLSFLMYCIKIYKNSGIQISTS